MATFYILPSRASLDQALSEVLGRFLPGLPLPADSWDVVTESLKTTAPWPEDVYLVPREELPEGMPMGEALAEMFGAEPGDRVVEINTLRSPTASRVWVLTQADVCSHAVAR